MAGSTALAPAETRHVVEEGDTLPRLVWQYRVSENAIRRANQLTSDTLHPGQVLTIPSAEATSSVPPPAPSSPPATAPVATAPVAVATEPAALARSTRPTDLQRVARQLGAKNIAYAASHRPAGENQSWSMDCSNTARLFFRRLAGVDLPRTASDQYRWLEQAGRLWRLPRNARRQQQWLHKELKPGDLLFWEHTYRPVRRPPVTHVMVYLGLDEQGRRQMFGAQGSRGVNFYQVDPHLRMGGYSTWLGLIRREGRLTAVGRPVDL